MRLVITVCWSAAAIALLTFSSCKPKEKPAPAISAGQDTITVISASPEWAQNANIYEVNIRQYTPEGTLNAFAKSLPRLKKMGVDILWFMPVHPISKAKRKGSMGSYYAVADYLAVNPEFGTMEDFKSAVKQAHDLGMKVIIDWVPNHTGWDHVWIKEHPGFYSKDAKGNITDPLDPKTGKSFGWTDVADLDYNNPSMRQAMRDALLFWLREAGIDGFRFDVAGEVPLDFWEETSPVLRKAKPDIFMLAEAEVPEHRNEELFAMSYGWSFHHLMKEIAKGKADATAIDEWYAKDRAAFQKGYHMHFIANHDENSWNGTEKESFGDGLNAFAVLAFTFDGMPLIYSGQEQGLNKRILFFEKDPIDWGTYVRQDFYATLLNLKHRNQALWNGEAGGAPVRIQTGNDKKIYAFYREKNGQKVLVILNLSPKTQAVELAGNAFAGSYVNVFKKTQVVLDANAKFTLPAWDYLVLSNVVGE